MLLGNKKGKGDITKYLSRTKVGDTQADFFRAVSMLS